MRDEEAFKRGLLKGKTITPIMAEAGAAAFAEIKPKEPRKALIDRVERAMRAVERV